ncbi:glutathione S-transferase family protein [Pokkaliibacter sp. CJK22405]|uniref:glutathione S-transferase family protein n=1 Tax=Pokkaliibacter sp. CJK22405 TaxID=3384615 RepID=UPI00398477DD
MGLLVDGVWHDQWYDTASTGGRFKRSESQFRHWVTADGSAGPTGEAGFAAQSGRYHLYVSLACPWAHRTLIYRKLKGLEEMISVSVVHPHMGENGWSFAPGEGVIADPLHQARFMYEVYLAADPHYSGRVTVPVLWDKQRNTIVSNESADIIRMFDTAFDGIGARPGSYYPADKREAIDAWNAVIYPDVNNGVYKSGFATSQEAYEEAVTALFARLDDIEQQLAGNRYLTGNEVTEADWRLFTTLVRFDPVYVGHFKCNLKRLKDYPNLWGYLCDLYQQPGIAETVNLDHIKTHYFTSHPTINPTRIVPKGPAVDYTERQNRGRFG